MIQYILITILPHKYNAMSVTIDSLLKEDIRYDELSPYFSKLTFSDLCSMWGHMNEKSLIELADTHHKHLMSIFVKGKLVPRITEHLKTNMNYLQKKGYSMTTPFNEILKCDPEYKVLLQYFGGVTLEDLANSTDNMSRQFFLELVDERDKDIMAKFADNVLIPLLDEIESATPEDNSIYNNIKVRDFGATDETDINEYTKYINPQGDSISPTHMVTLSSIAEPDDDSLTFDDNNTSTDTNGVYEGYNSDTDDRHNDTIDHYIDSFELHEEEKQEKDHDVSLLVTRCLKNGVLDLGGRLQNIPLYDIFMYLKKVNCDRITELNLSRNKIGRTGLVYVDYIVSRLNNLKILDLRGNLLESFSSCSYELRAILNTKSIKTIDIRGNPMTNKAVIEPYFKGAGKRELWKLIWIPEGWIEDDYWKKSVKDDENIREIIIKNHLARYKKCKIN